MNVAERSSGWSAVSWDGPNLDGIWDKLDNADPLISTEARNLILTYSDPLVRRCVRMRVADADLAGDLSNSVRLKLWNSLGNFRPQSPGAWLAYVKKTSDSCVVDHFRSKNSRLEVAELTTDIPFEEIETIDKFMSRAPDRQHLRDLADELWLGSKLMPSEILTLQLRLMHGLSERGSDSLLGSCGIAKDRNQGSTLGDLDKVSQFAFSCIYMSRDGLAGHVIDSTQVLDSDALDEISEQSRSATGTSPFGRWTWEELKIIIWRLRNGLLAEQIQRFRSCTFNSKELGELIAKVRGCYPFRARMLQVLKACQKLTQAPEKLKQDGLWKRLAFEYHVFDELTQKDILDRIASPGELVNRTITPGMMNVWLSNGRIFAQLIAFAEERRDA